MMFEQTFIEVQAGSKKPYTVLVSLLLQVAALAVLIIVPLIYTQVLPQAKLRSVFAAPTPPPPAMPKPPPTMSRMTAARPSFQPIFGKDLVPRNAPPLPREVAVGAAPNLGEGVMGGDSYATVPMDALQVKAPEPLPTPVAREPIVKRVRRGTMEASQLIHRVQPEYPPIAKQIHVQGAVEFTAVISKEGMIENLQLVRGHPILVAAARNAIIQWRYKPTILNGEPVEVITTITVNFTLNGSN